MLRDEISTRRVKSRDMKFLSQNYFGIEHEFAIAYTQLKTEREREIRFLMLMLIC